MKYPQKYGRPENSTKYCSYTVIPYIIKKRLTDGQKRCILSFPKKGDLGLAMNYRGITLTPTVAKIYNALLCNRIEPKIENTLRKNQNGFRRIYINNITNFEYLSNSWRCTCIKPRGNNIICRLRQGLWLHSQRKDGANTSRLRPTQRNPCNYNDVI